MSACSLFICSIFGANEVSRCTLLRGRN